MNYLTPSELKKAAPAAAKLPQSDENLTDTAAFLRHVATLGYHPIFATQGTPHADTEEPLKSRHIAVAANERGQTLAILNSHTIWRRAWLAAGFSWPDASRGLPTIILGAVVPLRRWKGFEAPLKEVLELRGSMATVMAALETWRPDPHQTRWMVRRFASAAYLKGHRKPSPQALYKALPGPDRSAASILRHLLLLVTDGGLPPEPVDSFKAPRRLKPLISPDALMNASNAAFQAGFAALTKYKRAPFAGAFPAFTKP